LKNNKKIYAAKIFNEKSKSLHYAVNPFFAFLNSNFVEEKSKMDILKMSKSKKSSRKFESENAHFFDMTLK
jgi:hypothetical protein